MKKILIIQTAFLGDVILATPIIEKLHRFYPDARIDFLLRKGNESLLKDDPRIDKLWIHDKKEGKFTGLYKLIGKIRAEQYDLVVNLHRFLSSGIISAFSGAKQITGFDKNPLSFFYTHRHPHIMKSGVHEVDRNLSLVEKYTDKSSTKPKLYINPAIESSVKHYKSDQYICIAPASIWFTKQFPAKKWNELITRTSPEVKIYLLGSSDDHMLCEQLRQLSNRVNVINLSGKLNLLQSAALMKDALMNYVNDSAPMHLASSVNAPVTAVYCSTIPAFGFGPISDNANIVETKEQLDCRPCGLHGHRNCPKQHFNCAFTVSADQFKIF